MQRRMREPTRSKIGIILVVRLILLRLSIAVVFLPRSLVESKQQILECLLDGPRGARGDFIDDGCNIGVCCVCGREGVEGVVVWVLGRICVGGGVFECVREVL
jgi:hypothetical protein